MIRNARPEDLPAIEELMRASLSVLGAHFYDAAQIPSAVRHIAVPDRQLVDDGTYYVVVEDDRLVACGGWSWRQKLFTGTADQDATTGDVDPSNDPARIRAMFVHPDYARRGLGRLILETSENAAREMGFRRFELMATLPGVPLYEACGYTSVERVTLDLPDGTKLGCVRMVK
jgi:GNAT superfamily N-acetyltransferase